MTIDRDPEFGGILEDAEAVIESALKPAATAAEDAASALIDIFDGGDGNGASGGGESGGGGSTDPWGPSPLFPDPTPHPEIPPELDAIINPVVDPNEPWRIN